jgi:hypothetical protein
MYEIMKEMIKIINIFQIKSFIVNNFIPQFTFGQMRVRLAVIFFNDQPIAGEYFDFTANQNNQQLQAVINGYQWYTGLTNPDA